MLSKKKPNSGKRPFKQTKRRNKRARKTTEEVTVDDCATVEEDASVDDAIDKFCISTLVKGLEGIKAEYASLANFTPKESTVVACDANSAKNRFGNIPCYDKTRVVLKYQVPPETDYIHANWIDHPSIKTTPRYMCCQGPLPETIGDMWRLIWQEKPRNVVILCQLVENGKNKCADYFPRNAGEIREVNNFNIECTKIRRSSTKAHDTFEIKVTADGDTRVIYFHQWHDWPDFGVPPNGDGIIRLLRNVRQDPGNVGLIHCSAGVGRTGTMLGIIYTLKSLSAARETNVIDIVKEIRSCRACSVQNEGQYLFIYKAVFDYIKRRSKNQVRPEVVAFAAIYASYKPPVPVSTPPRASAPASAPAPALAPAPVPTSAPTPATPQPHQELPTMTARLEIMPGPQQIPQASIRPPVSNAPPKNGK